MAPPMERKKVTEAVATPMCRRSTLFCTAVTTTCMVKPKPDAERVHDQGDDVVRRIYLESGEREERRAHDGAPVMGIHL